MKNNYGNYVVQKALKLANESDKTKLVNCIIRNIDKIGDKKLIHKWKSIILNYTDFNPFEGGININCIKKKSILSNELDLIDKESLLCLGEICINKKNDSNK